MVETVERLARRAVGLVVALACAVAPLPAHAASTAPELVFVERAARAHFELGMERFHAKRYADAIVALDAAYAIEPHPQLLYARAQARRLADDCASALKLYEEFLATSPPTKEGEQAQINVARCKATLGMDTPPQPEAPPVVALPTPEPVQPEGPAAPPVVALPPVRKDIPGGVLTGVGGVLTGAGLGMLLGALARSAALTSPSHSQFDRRYQQIRGVHIGGAVVLGVGLGLLIGGVTRYAVVARKRRQPARAR